MTAPGTRPSALKKWIVALIPVFIAVFIALLPTPQGLKPHAWYYFATFVGIIVGIALESLPMGLIGLIGICLVSVLNLLDKKPAQTLDWALSGFSNSVVWLVFAAMIFAVALNNTGIGRRIALMFIKKIGRTSLGLGYAIALADFVLGPFMPSNTARSLGTMYPITRSAAEALGSHPGDSAGKVGSFLMFTAFTCTFVSSSTFLTAAAMSILAVDYIAKATGLPPLSWMGYLEGFIPQAVIVFTMTPLIAYWFFPPTVKRFENAQEWASGELRKMGPLSTREIVTLAIFLLALLGWIFMTDYLPPAMVAFIAMVLMIVFRAITWDDMLGDKGAWNITIVLATLITMASGLKIVGFLDWMTLASTTWVSHAGFSAIMIMIVIAVLDYVIHYLYVSITAHVITLFPLWLALAAAIPGFPVQLLGVLLIHTKEGYGAMTPYAAGHGVGYMLSGYFPDHKRFWKAETVWSYTYLLIMLVSIPYWIWLYGYK